MDLTPEEQAVVDQIVKTMIQFFDKCDDPPAACQVFVDYTRDRYGLPKTLQEYDS